MGQVLDLIDQWWALLEGDELDRLSSIVASDAEITMPGMSFRGPAEFRPVLEAYLGGFPDMHHEVVSCVEDGDSAAVEIHVTMTHTGTFATPMGELPATGRTVILDSCDVVRTSNGRISSWHAYFDQASLMAQLTAAG